MSTQPMPLTPEQIAGAESAQWKTALKQAINALRVAAPGIIQSFDAVHQTAVVEIAIYERVKTPAGPQLVSIPALQDVPVVLPRAGGYALTLPIKAGDECLLVFSDMCIDLWWSRGGIQPQFEIRRHDLSDAFCIPGPWNQKRLLQNYSTTSAQLRSEDRSVIVDLAASTVTVTAPTIEVNAASSLNLSSADLAHLSSASRLTLSGVRINIGSLPTFSNNAAALLGGLLAGDLYRNGDAVNVVH
jgi:hypothetical protein